MLKRSVIVAVAMLLFSFFGGVQAEKCDVEYWQYFNWKNLERGPYKLYTTGEIRLNDDMCRFYFYRATGNFRYRAMPYLDLEAHYTLIEDRPKNAKHFRLVQRVELEVNPFFSLDNGITFSWRNRVEFIKTEYVSKITSVFRHQFMLSFPIKNCGRLRSISCYDEIFYNLTTSEFTQNRFVPVELTYALSRKTTIALFVAYRSFRGANLWYHSLVLGSKLGF